MLNLRVRQAARTLAGIVKKHGLYGPRTSVKPISQIRFLSSNSNEQNKSPGPEQTSDTQQDPKTKSEVVKLDYDEYDDYEELPKDWKDTAIFAARLFMRLALLSLAGVCLYFTANELFPGRMNPNGLFSELFDKLRYNYQIQAMVGEGMKAFGRDVGRNTEGRRNHVDSYSYEAEDKSKRLRIRFNIKGDKGQILVFAEVSSKMKDNEYVYIICQNVRTGKVYTVEDNREQIAAGLYTPNGMDLSFLAGSKN